jgi:F-type H+-transporting ATPase subunit delta
MQPDTRVARRYARALFRVAQKGDAVASVESDLDVIARLLTRDRKFKDFLFSPRIGREDKLSLVETVFADRVTATSMRAIRLMLSKRREGLFPEVRDQFIELRRRYGNVLYGQITSAAELSEDQRRRIVSKLEGATQKKVEADFRVDPALIGGVKVSYGNYVLDGTIRGGLRRLRDQLRYELLKQA